MTPTTYASLVDELVATFAASRDESEALIDHLADAGVIISELVASPVGDPSAYACKRLKTIDASTADTLASAMETLASLDAAPLRKRPLKTLKSVSEKLSRLVSDRVDHSLQIDMHSPFCGNLNAAVLDDVARLAQYWRRLAPGKHLSKYRARFIERYEGSERMVPLLELVDPNIGLGFPEAPESVNANAEDRRSLLVRIACQALRTGTEEHLLDRNEIDILLPPLPDRDAALRSMEIGFHVAARSAEAIDRGEYRIVPAAFHASDRATRSLGRFADLFDDQTRERIRDAALRSVESDALAAEVVYLPPWGRGANVLVRPPFFRTELRIGIGEPTVADELTPDDLWVGLHNGDFFLWSRSRNRRVMPLESHVFATDRAAPNICRFLSYLADGAGSIGAFDWGPAAQHTYLPRVRLGRVVLAPRRWLFERRELGSSEKEFESALAGWRSLWSLPRFVNLASGDQRLLIDLDSPIAGKLIDDQVPVAAHKIEFVEALPSSEEIWTTDERGHRYVVEFVASVFSSHRENASRDYQSVPNVIASRTRHGLASRWSYAKLYGGAQSFDDLLVNQIAPLANLLRSSGAIDRWFFVRYADPVPSLRVRLRAVPQESGSVRRRFAELTDEWLAEERIVRCAFDTYDPEYERYGEGDAMDATERFFTSDSDRCVDMLRQTPGTDERICAVAETFFATVLASDAAETLLAAIASAPKRLQASDRTHLKRLSTADPVAAIPGLDEALAGPQRITRLASFFHMHCNRMGLDEGLEARAAALLRALTASHIARGRVVRRYGRSA